MNVYAIVLGVVLALVVIAGRRPRGTERLDMFYPALLATFPLFYWGFAAYAQDYGALFAEMAIGVVFFALAYAAFRYGGRFGLWLLAAGYLAHTAYDVMHESLVHSSGTPTWWPEFCGAIDLLIGVYLAYAAATSFPGPSIMNRRSDSGPSRSSAPR